MKPRFARCRIPIQLNFHCSTGSPLYGTEGFTEIQHQLVSTTFAVIRTLAKCLFPNNIINRGIQVGCLHHRLEHSFFGIFSTSNISFLALISQPVCGIWSMAFRRVNVEREDHLENMTPPGKPHHTFHKYLMLYQHYSSTQTHQPKSQPCCAWCCINTQQETVPVPKHLKICNYEPDKEWENAWRREYKPYITGE